MGQAEEIFSRLGRGVDKGISTIRGVVDKVQNINKPNLDNTEQLIACLEGRASTTDNDEDAILLDGAAKTLRSQADWIRDHGGDSDA